jgi:hypothetical protein
VPLSSTKRALIVVGVLILLAAAAGGIYLVIQRRPLPGANSGKAPDILSLLPADAPVIIYIDAAALRRLQGSPLAAVLGLAGPSPPQDRDYAQFIQGTGFNYTRDLDKAAIAFWPAGMATPANPLGDDRILAIVDGRFDQQKIGTYALRTGGVETRGAHSVYEIPGSPPVSLEFFSPERIAIASGKNADALLGVSNSPARDPAMQSRINRVAGAPIFGVARLDNLPGSFYANFQNAPQLDHLVRSIRALSLAGTPQGDNIMMTLDAECDSMKNAFEISTILDGFRMFGSLALADPRNRRQMTREQAAFTQAFLKQVQISHQDRWVRMSLGITPEMLGTASASIPDKAPVSTH